MPESFRLSSTMTFTLSMLAVLVVAGVYSHSHLGTLDTVFYERMGHSAHLLWLGVLHRILTSVVFTSGGWQFYSSLAMFGLSVGWLEWQCGTLTTVLVFFDAHVTTLALMFLGMALENWIVQSQPGSLLWFTRDVGPSAGYYGCLGLAVMMQSTAPRNAIIIAILSVLILRFGYSAYHLHESARTMSADVAHLIAFSMGLCFARVMR